MNQISQLKQEGVTVKQACAAFDIARSSYYYKPRPTRTVAAVRPASTRALSPVEREQVHGLLNSDRFADQAPRQMYATLLDEGVYHCSVSTMYRILHTHQEVKERRNQRVHPVRRQPQLQTTAPNQLWSWDITKLDSPHKYVYFYLYVILDVFSRYVVGWMIAEAESAELAQQLISRTCAQQQVASDQLTLHADNGGPMVALTTAQLLETLGVQKTHSRPYTPNDNAFSEAQFKTLKYRPDFPDQFPTVAEARAWARTFFNWYNQQHHHSSLALLTPEVVHTGVDKQVIQQRDSVLQTAFATHPERFVHGLPHHPKLPTAVWINPPLESDLKQAVVQ